MVELLSQWKANIAPDQAAEALFDAAGKYVPYYYDSIYEHHHLFEYARNNIDIFVNRQWGYGKIAETD